MEYTKLYLFLEGNDDERFFNKKLTKKLEEIYTKVEILKFAAMKLSDRRKYIRTILNKENWDYICVCDIDTTGCYPEKKRSIINKNNLIEEDKIVVVIKEIESWYLAGINNDFLRSIRAGLIDRNCNEITKEIFNNLIPKKMPRVIFMDKILENYNFNLAKRNNSSFLYFLRTFLDEG